MIISAAEKFLNGGMVCGSEVVEGASGRRRLEKYLYKDLVLRRKFFEPIQLFMFLR